MITEIKKINKLSLANILGLIHGLIGFFVGAFFYLYFLLRTLLRTDIIITSWISFLSNFSYVLFSAILISLLSGIIAWVSGFLIALFYNLFASKLGGVRVEMENKDYSSKLFKNY